MTTWELLNLPVDAAIGLSARIMATAGIAPATLDRAAAPFLVQRIGLTDLYRRHVDDDIGLPVVLAPATAHYSWAKTAALLGLGANALRLVAVNDVGRMDLVALRRALDHCLEARRPVLQVVAVLGSIGESAVDPLAGILSLREEYREMGLDFAVHADAAGGGYFAAMVRPPRDSGAMATLTAPDLIDRRPDIQLSPYVRRQLQAIAGADSVTLDPHKSGFCPTSRGRCAIATGRCATLSPLPRRWSSTTAAKTRSASSGSKGRSPAQLRPASSCRTASSRPIKADMAGFWGAASSTTSASTPPSSPWPATTIPSP
ncbi:pyridoxal-dependent decarboxylase [Palleronia sp. KMU-117]|uniref:pyridoxal-dependent decarboxylase n=1 Tax=Palleronia sp. KMU-117 TaxID=3434108 RepID=UPI003D71DFF1